MSNEPVKDAILQILMLSKFTKRHDLRHQLMNAGFTLPDREMRKVVESMIVDNCYSIQSSGKGYSLIVTHEDLNDAVEYLEKKSKAIAIRKNCLLRNFQSGKLHQQLTLTFG
jgi:hypothetical protein